MKIVLKVGGAEYILSNISDIIENTVNLCKLMKLVNLMVPFCREIFCFNNILKKSYCESFAARLIFENQFQREELE